MEFGYIRVPEISPNTGLYIVEENMPNIVVTANGRELDMEALRLQNEKTVALGNMKVNARGDELDQETGEVYQTRQEKMQDYYRLHTPVPTRKSRRTPAAPPAAQPAAAPVVQAPVVQAPVTTTTATKTSSKENQ